MTKTPTSPKPSRQVKLLARIQDLIKEEYGTYEPEDAGFMIAVWDYEDPVREGATVNQEIVVHGSSMATAVAIDTVINMTKEHGIMESLCCLSAVFNRADVDLSIHPNLEILKHGVRGKDYSDI